MGPFQRRSLPFWGSFLLGSTALSGVPAALAAETQSTLETVTVTAQKREENLQKVPMNVQAITSEKLDELHLKNFTDFQLYMPSVTYAESGQGSNGGPGYVNVTMRGIASDQNGNHSGPLPTVGVYFDEQPITTINGTLDIPTYDIARVEALSGPQGTLYGASAESGVIRIISNKPDPSGFEAGYQAEVNAVDHGGVGYLANGFVNEPISDNVALRAVAWVEHDAGYIDNVHRTRTYTFDTGAPPVTLDNANRAENNYNTVDKYGMRAALGIDLNDSWTITPSLMMQQENTNGVFAFNKGDFGYNKPLGDLEVAHFSPEYSRDFFYQAALTVQGKIANLDVLYAGGYMDRKISAEADYSDYTFWYDQIYPSYVDFFNNSGQQIDPTQNIFGKDHFTKDSQELRISNSKDNRLRFVAGLFYERQGHAIFQDYVINGLANDPATCATLGIVCAVAGFPNTLWLTDEQRIDRDYAAFTEVSFDILPNLTLTGGVRLFKADNSLSGWFGFESYATGPSLHCHPEWGLSNHGHCSDLNAEVKETGETHRVNLTWQIDDDRMVYATYSTGFRPGGVNRRTDIPGIGPYDSDTLDNYEIGWKTSWQDNRLRFNGDFFWEDWNNFQFPFLGPNSVTIIANVGNATSKGVESDVSWLPIDNLTLDAAAAYTEADLGTDYCNGDCSSNPVLSPKGTQLPITPKWKLNGTARYQWNIGDFLAHVQGSLVHESGRWDDLKLIERSLLGKARAFTTFDFTAGIDRDNWALELSLKNAFDERAELDRYAECRPGICGLQTYILPAQPRTIALTWSQRF